MHILHMDLGHEMRGGQHQVLLLLKALRDAGHSSTLLARGGSPLLESAVSLRFNVKPATWRNLRRLSGEHDIVHTHDARSHSWAALASRRPFVVSRRVAFPVGSSWLSRLKYRRAARFLAVSQFVATKLEAAGVSPSKIDVVFDAVEDSGQLSWKPDAPAIALATNDPKKGRDLVEQAAAISKIPILFSSDLKKDLMNASVFIYISRSEGFGSAALLAMSMGVPVIASRIDGMVEVFEDGVSGLSVENDPAVIAAAMERVVTNPEFAASLVAHARSRVAALFSPSVMLLKTLASYRSALAI